MKLQRQLGITTIYVTHDQEEALMLSTRIAVMYRGHLVQLDTPQEVYERPADAFVADFLGGANFLSGTVRGVSGGDVTVSLQNGATLRASAARNPEVQPGDSVTVCLRPESLELIEPGSPSGSANVLDGTVRMRSYLGWLLACEVELTGGVAVRVQTTTPRAHLRFTEGGPVAVRFHQEDVLLLKSAS